jgi:hypothetical protein
MRPSRCLVPVLLVAAVLIAPLQLGATTLLHMDLGDLVQRADRIFRGTVVDVEQGVVAAGGGELPAVTYRLKVEESFKGGADIVKGDAAMIEIRMVGSIKAATASGDLQHFSAFRDVPRLKMGSDYLLFTTPPSAVGLSVTVGLGQGAFTVFSRNREDFAVNEFNNAGLGFDSAGPVAYSEISAKIRALLGQ